jgi:Tol biopolymer transport system component
MLRRMRTRFLLPIAACAALAFPAAADGAYRGGNGNIAVVESFINSGNGDTDLRLLRSNGKVLKRSLQHCALRRDEDVPEERFCPSSPDFSRDGRKLAFAIDSDARGTPNRLVVANADGSAPVTLPALTQEDSEPAWTRDGELLFTGKQGGARNLFIVKSDGTGLRQITRKGGRSGACSSRGLIAYVARRYVRLVRADGTHDRRLARGDNPDFSPSGAKIVYDRDVGTDAGGFTVTSVFSVRIKRGAKRRRVVKAGRDPVFSPSGKRVLYLRDEDRGAGLFTVTPTGKRRKRIRRLKVDAVYGEASFTDPAWQPRP